VRALNLFPLNVTRRSHWPGRPTVGGFGGVRDPLRAGDFRFIQGDRGDGRRFTGSHSPLGISAV